MSHERPHSEAVYRRRLLSAARRQSSTIDRQVDKIDFCAWQQLRHEFFPEFKNRQKIPEHFLFEPEILRRRVYSCSEDPESGELQTSLSYQRACHFIEWLWREQQVGLVDQRQQVLSQQRFLNLIQQEHPDLLEILEKTNQQTGLTPLQEIHNRVFVPYHIGRYYTKKP
jgi:hypothetical protein